MTSDAPPAIEMTEVDLAYGAVHALRAVSLAVPAGSVTGLIGRNGAGKSTAIRLLAGLLEPTGKGSEVRVLGLDPARQTRSVMRQTGFLLSDPALFAYLTARETLEFLGRAFDLPPTERGRRADDLLGFFELDDAADRLADGFSTGMRKRLALAAALVHAPRLLVLDEPFESLDPLMVRSLKRLLTEYARGGGTVLLSSHLLDAVEEICDRVVILEQGAVVVAGNREEVRAGIADRLPTATLEDLYASLVPSGPARPLDWLTAPAG